jgi:hypothetical protein
MKEYILTLKEGYSDQVQVDLRAFGAEVIWVSKGLPNLIAVESEKSIEELRELLLVKSVTENIEGEFLFNS